MQINTMVQIRVPRIIYVVEWFPNNDGKEYPPPQDRLRDTPPQKEYFCRERNAMLRAAYLDKAPQCREVSYYVEADDEGYESPTEYTAALASLLSLRAFFVSQDNVETDKARLSDLDDVLGAIESIGWREFSLRFSRTMGR